jgi:hypothetical protein
LDRGRWAWWRLGVVGDRMEKDGGKSAESGGGLCGVLVGVVSTSSAGTTAGALIRRWRE